MPLTPDQFTFRRFQSDGGPVTVFSSLSSALPDGSTVEGPWQSADVIPTTEEQAVLDAITARGRQQIADRINAEQAAAKAAASKQEPTP
jgi:hypothetical protein